MAAAPQGGGQGGENAYAILWIVAAIFAALACIWYVFESQIVSFYMSLKIYELSFVERIANIFHSNTLNIESLRQSLVKTQTIALTYPKEIKFTEVINLGGNVGVWLRIPLALIMFVLAIIVYKGNTTRIYKRIYTMRDFAKLESKNWPQITPIVNLDLIKTDIDTGPWAMALTPMQFCKKNKLLEEVRPARREGMSRKDWDRIEVVLKRGKTNQLFAMQLGPIWAGTAKLPIYTRALFAAFAARINADSKPAEKLLLQIAASSSDLKKLNFEGVDALLQKHEKTKLVQEIVNSHAYVSTVMASMLAAARDDGVQATADFLWLKPLDRRLWYTLNTVGRQTPFIEIAGIFAHWISEKEAGRKLHVPMVEEATHAVELALKDVVYRPDET